PCLPSTFKLTCNVVAWSCAISPGRPTTAVNSSGSCSPTVPVRIFPPPSLTSALNMSASHPPLIPTRAMWKPFTASSKMSSLIWNPSPAAPTSWPKLPSTKLYFNLARPNSHKRGLTPWQIIGQLEPRLPLHLCLLPPVLLDYRLDSQGGYDLPRYPLG